MQECRGFFFAVFARRGESVTFCFQYRLGFVSREGRGRFQFVRNVTCAAAIDVDSSVAGLDFEDDDMSSPQLSELRELWI